MKKTYPVLSRIDGDRHYDAGDTIDLTDSEAAGLLACPCPAIGKVPVGSDDAGNGNTNTPPADASAEPGAELQALTNKELKAMADGLGITLPANTNKAGIIALIVAKQAEQPAAVSGDAGTPDAPAATEGAQQ